VDLIKKGTAPRAKAGYQRQSNGLFHIRCCSMQNLQCFIVNKSMLLQTTYTAASINYPPEEVYANISSQPQTQATHLLSKEAHANIVP
jgi:hypothetical protein